MAGLDGFAVDVGDDVAGANVGSCGCKRAAGNHLADFKAIACIILVEECTEVAYGKGSAGCRVASAGVRCVELAKYFAEQYCKVAVVVDIGQEAAVSLTIAFPVHAVQIDIVELFGHLLQHVVVDVFAFKRRMAVVVGVEIDWLYAARRERYLAHARARKYKQVVALCIGHKAAVYITGQQLGFVVLNVLDI